MSNQGSLSMFVVDTVIQDKRQLACAIPSKISIINCLAWINVIELRFASYENIDFEKICSIVSCIKNTKTCSPLGKIKRIIKWIINGSINHSTDAASEHKKYEKFIRLSQ